VALGNLLNGVFKTFFTNAAISGNLISGNGSNGVSLNGVGGDVRGNLIGTDASGTQPVGNGGAGVQVNDVVHTIGGLGSGDGNIIAFNTGAGVSLVGIGAASILSNSIFSNGGLGIDIGADGVTPNDPCDTDGEFLANEVQNYPDLTSASIASGSIRIQGSLNSTPNTAFRLQFFSNSSCDPSGFGEGKTLIGTMTVTTGSNCRVNFSFAFPTVDSGQFITATATSPTNETSEFSNCIALSNPQAQILQLIQDVDSLVAQGILNRGEANSLTAKLRSALQQMERANATAASNQLRAFINQVRALVQSGRLSSTQGQQLIDTANVILAQMDS
jgi:hypothetical protein